jgi:hypothetical protein
MTDPRMEDHAVGLELQLVELVEQKQRAEVQGRKNDVARLETQIEPLQFELAATAERLSAADSQDHEALTASADVHAPSAQELVDHS